ncbi:MAG: hypothetical protein NVS3B26_26920 [Mycobacteriales bacterium]
MTAADGPCQGVPHLYFLHIGVTGGSTFMTHDIRQVRPEETVEGANEEARCRSPRNLIDESVTR